MFFVPAITSSNLFIHGQFLSNRAGLYPLVGWVIRDETVFIAEGNTIGTSASIELMKTMGLFDDVAVSSDMAYSVEGSNGVCFIPAFNGIQAPVNDPRAVTLLLGMFSQWPNTLT